MGLRATPKSDETLKIAVELAKLLRAGERLKGLLVKAVPEEAPPPAEAATRTNIVHRKQPPRQGSQQLAITDAVIPDAAPTAAHTIGKCQGICDFCVEPCGLDLDHKPEQLRLFGAGITHGCRCVDARRAPSKLGCLSLNRAGELLFKYFWQNVFARFVASASWLAPLLLMLLFVAPRVAARLLGHGARSSVHTGVAVAGAVIEETVNAVETALDFDSKGNGTLYSTTAEGSVLPRWLVLLIGLILTKFRVPGS